MLIGVCVLVGIVSPDEAASRGAYGAVVARVVARCTTSNRSLDTPFGRCRCRQRCKRKDGSNQNARDSHGFTLWMSEAFCRDKGFVCQLVPQFVKRASRFVVAPVLGARL